MELGRILFWVFVVGIAFCIIHDICIRMPLFYQRVPKKCKQSLKFDAEIVDFVSVKHYGGRWFGDYEYIETKVIFDDGFVYVSHKSAPSGIFSIKLNDSVIRIITDDAQNAHYAAWKKYGNKPKKSEIDPSLKWVCKRCAASNYLPNMACKRCRMPKE